MRQHSVDDFEFTEKWPQWANDKPDDTVAFVGVIEQGEWFKPIIRLEDGFNRRWVYRKTGAKTGEKMPYGPDLPPHIEKMMVTALEAKL